MHTTAWMTCYGRLIWYNGNFMKYLYSYLVAIHIFSVLGHFFRSAPILNNDAIIEHVAMWHVL